MKVFIILLAKNKINESWIALVQKVNAKIYII
jgi:hypothetical protein